MNHAPQFSKKREKGSLSLGRNLQLTLLCVLTYKEFSFCKLEMWTQWYFKDVNIKHIALLLKYKIYVCCYKK